MVCHMKGEKSHRIIADGLQIRVNLTHRGACGCDETTGDGAGILMQMPHIFLQKISAEASIRLPAEKEYASALALIHQRYSTNTFPTWDLAHPFHFLCHNGEINTLRGNVNWMNARQYLFQSELFGEDMSKLFPIATPGASDSAIFDNAVELLYHSGRSLPRAIMMMIPEAWQRHATMDDPHKAFYEYHSCMIEPWDGPASIAFSDGTCIGAVLDRNGLRPSRYTVTKDDLVIMASETGVLDVQPQNVRSKGRLQPGRMFLIDIKKGRIVEDEEIKTELAARKPYRQWLEQNQVTLDQLPDPPENGTEDSLPLKTRQLAFGYSMEDLRLILAPMAREGQEPIGSMGDDIPPAILSSRPRLLFDYFKQLFAQVTNPPLDAIREELVTSLATTIGPEQDLFQETPQHCRKLKLNQPILDNSRLEQIRNLNTNGLRSDTLAIFFPISEGGPGLQQAMAKLCRQATSAVKKGANILILSDRGTTENLAPIPSLLDLGGKYKWRRDGEVHQYNPISIAKLQQAVRSRDETAWQTFSELVNAQNRREGLIRGLFEFKAPPASIALEEVEPADAIVRRFKTGAMSCGSINQEAHETLAIAMNRIGAKSNSGEGGEDPDRYHPDDNGDWRGSAIKQVASSRFGVTGAYLASATDLQIKMAQGAKPGEGGQLPAFKVYPWIAKTRQLTPYVGLISPPPHHDIYSIEDLAQLIHDLKMPIPGPGLTSNWYPRWGSAPWRPAWPRARPI